MGHQFVEDGEIIENQNGKRSIYLVTHLSPDAKDILSTIRGVGLPLKYYQEPSEKTHGLYWAFGDLKTGN